MARINSLYMSRCGQHGGVRSRITELFASLGNASDSSLLQKHSIPVLYKNKLREMSSLLPFSSTRDSLLVTVGLIVELSENCLTLFGTFFILSWPVLPASLPLGPKQHSSLPLGI